LCLNDFLALPRSQAEPGNVIKEAPPRLLTLCIFREFSGKLFVLFFVLPKVPASGTLGQKQATHFLHEVLRAKGYRVNTLGSASRHPLRRSLTEEHYKAETCNEV